MTSLTLGNIAEAVRVHKERMATLEQVISGLQSLGDKPEMLETLTDELNKLRADLAVVCPNDPMVVDNAKSAVD